MANLYLIPNQLSSGNWQDVLPERVKTLAGEIRYYIVENVRNARRFLKMISKDTDIDSLVFFELNEHTEEKDIPGYLLPAEEGSDMAVISEAGCPGVADPGAVIVRLAHQKGIRVIPVAGPSSIIMALMASGMNGQHFAFLGYLPVKPPQRITVIKQLEKKAWEAGQTQLFMETPYRNNKLLSNILGCCRNDTLLGIAAGITGEDEFISVAPVSEWKKRPADLRNIPAIFMIGRG